MAEILTQPDSNFSVERPVMDESELAWQTNLNADQEAWNNLLKENNLNPERFQPYETSEEILADFADGLRQSFGLLSRPDTVDRIQTTLAEGEWAGVPAHFAGDGEVGANHLSTYLAAGPDYSLHSWILDSLNQPADQKSEAYQADITTGLFADQTDHERWEQAFDRHRSALESLAEKLGLPKLSESQLKLLALTLRLGIVGTNPYLKESIIN